VCIAAGVRGPFLAAWCVRERLRSRPPLSLAVLGAVEWISEALGLPFFPKSNSKTCVAAVTIHPRVGVRFWSFLGGRESCGGSILSQQTSSSF
jgi:hypothetical protein